MNVSLGGGLTAIVKNPKKVFDEVRYVGDGQANGYVDLQSERGPSRKDLRVGQRVVRHLCDRSWLADDSGNIDRRWTKHHFNVAGLTSWATRQEWSS